MYLNKMKSSISFYRPNMISNIIRVRKSKHFDFFCHFQHNVKLANKENEVVEPQIVRAMKNVLLVADSNGKVQKYQRVETPKPKKKANRVAKHVAKRSPKQKKKVSFSGQIAAMTNPCTVAIDRLSKAEIDSKVAQLDKEAKIRSIKEHIKSLPCKIVLNR